jgi:monooxygenase
VAIADGPSILKYGRKTVAEFGIDKKMCFQHMVTDASWPSETSTWTMTAQVGPAGRAGGRLHL